MHVAIRADASPAIGGGHIVRCLAIGEELVRRGHTITFLTAPGTLDAVPALRDRGFAQEDIPAGASPSETAARVASTGADLVLFDHYGLGAEFESMARPIAPVAVIDDALNRAHDCDILVDPTLNRLPADYAHLLPDLAIALTGTAYAPLRADFRRLRDQAVARRSRASTDATRVFVAFGATDPRGLTIPTTEALLTELPHVELDVLIGPAAPGRETLERLAAASGRVRALVDPPNLAEIMAEADLAVGASGTMSWERCCLGLPAVVVPVVDNQREIAVALSRFGAAIAIDTKEADLPGRLAAGAAALARDAERRIGMGRLAAKVCDGRGAERVADGLEGIVARRLTATATDDAQIRLRPVSQADSRWIWEWRNDTDTRAASKTTDPVPWDDHLTWFERAKDDPDTILLIGEHAATGEPIGIVRFNRHTDRRIFASINLAPEARGRGLGTALLGAGCRHACRRWGPRDIFAEIRQNNLASQRAFERCCFALVESGETFLTYRLAPGGSDR